MSIAAVGNGYTPTFPSLSGARPAAVPEAITAPKGANRAEYAREYARHYAGIAELETSRINHGIDSYNHFREDNVKKIVEEIKGNRKLLKEHLRAYGEGWEKEVEENRLRMQELAKRSIESADQGLRMSLNVAGSTYSYDSKIGAYARGAFTASVNLGDAAIRFDSKKGPEISVLGGAFTAILRAVSSPRRVRWTTRL